MLDKHFDFINKEAEIFQKWEKSGVFTLNAGVVGQREKAPIYDNVLPPPNANGELHIGHCSGYAVMDILGRYHRLRGERVLLVPGKDHAGIQTQVVYERKLRAEGIEIEKMSREEFWKSCYGFCTDRGTYMRGQEKLIGTSADFENDIFTLDPRVSATVLETFVKMYKDGLAYRGNRIINWSVYSQTSISDVEVEYKEEKGHLWHIEYPIVEPKSKPERKRAFLSQFPEFKLINNVGNHWVILAKSNENENLRLGEVLISIDKKDEIEIERDMVIFSMKKFVAEKIKDEEISKYSDELRAKMKNMVGEFVVIDLVPDLDRTDAIIVATTRPETMLGDSAVAVHPADPRYSHLIGSTVKIPIANREIKIIADDRIEISFGTGAVKITPAHDFLDYQIGLDHKLEQIQVINKFGKMTELVGKAYEGMTILDCRIQLVKDLEALGKLLLTEEINHKVPISERGKDVVEPLISTQWFINVDKEGLSLKKRAIELVNSGRINVYPARSKDMIVKWLENLNDWNVSRQIVWGHRMPVWYQNKDQANEVIWVGLDQPEGEGWVQETDTFDTWFSSGQWPYSTLAALGLVDLEKTSESDFFPSHTMVMGRDLLLFWACRMILFSTYRVNDIPWKNLYFTGLVRDAKGQKMSKSKGNGVEPRELLSKYGADALRAGFIAGSTAGQDIKFSEKKVESYAKFVNKIWNASKLVEMKVDGKYDWKRVEFEDLKLNSSRWIVSTLNTVEEEYMKHLDAYDLSGAFDVIYHFAWDTFCSWYLEIAKTQTDLENGEEVKGMMLMALEAVLQMLHPFMPFFTEEIHENLDKFGGELLLAQKIMKVSGNIDTQSCLEMQKIFDAVTAAREVRKVVEKGFLNKLDICMQFTVNQEDAQVIEKMANVERMALTQEQAIIIPYSSGIVMIGSSPDEKKLFKENLLKSLAKKKQELEVLGKILTPGFKLKADPDLVEEREAQFNQISAEVETIEKELSFN